MRLNKKMFPLLLMFFGALSGIILLMMWANLLGSFAFIKPLIEALSGEQLCATNFARYTSVSLFALLTVVLLSSVLMLFSKNKKFNIICISITILTILYTITICAVATSYCYGDESKLLETSAIIITAFQSQLLSLIVALLIPLTIQIVTTFKKNTKLNENEIKEETAINE